MPAVHILTEALPCFVYNTEELVSLWIHFAVDPHMFVAMVICNSLQKRRKQLETPIVFWYNAGHFTYFFIESLRASENVQKEKSLFNSSFKLFPLLW